MKSFDPSVRREIAKRRQQGGRWLQILREDVRPHLTQLDLATQSGMDLYAFVSQIETGRTNLPEKYYAIWANALKVPFDEFLAYCLYFFHHPNVSRESGFVNDHMQALQLDDPIPFETKDENFRASFISQIEGGHIRVPVRLYPAYARALNVPYDDFLAGCLYFYHDPVIAINSQFVRERTASLKISL